jgi:hypothetical protein
MDNKEFEGNPGSKDQWLLPVSSDADTLFAGTIFM